MANSNNIIDKVLLIDTRIEQEKPIKAKIQTNNMLIECGLEIGGGGRFPYYEDEYVVTPRLYEQNLATKNKSMREDVKILEIPREEVSNQYGTTFVIAREG